MAAQLRCGEDWQRIAVTNVTTSGLRCRSPKPPKIAEKVEIRYQGFSIVGVVQWCEDENFGVVCDDMVDVDMLVAGSPEVDIGRRALPRLEVRIPARFIAGDVTAPVVVHDVSPSGARLCMSAPPRRGIHGIIRWDGVDCPCTVVWSSESMFGVIFGDDLPDEPLQVSRPTASGSGDAQPGEAEVGDPAPGSAASERKDRRNGNRVSVSWPCEVHHADSRRAHVHLTNISTSGCVVGWFAGCRTDAPLYIKLPNLSSVKAEVVWKNDYRIGCRFAEPLNAFVLEHLLTERFG